ncbi:MAG: RAMP superfamily CRISPR-associated protein [Fimbriimonadaceae bacterium]|nr:MAG: RAMP superfamily CRISPR-associated protein [Fimbriimonadaceae bacterium]
MRMRVSLPEALKEVPDAPPQKIRLKLRLATPMIGGGVESGQPDEDWPIRASAIRGHLRWWWRAVHGFSLSPAEMRKQEAQLWGWAGRIDEDGKRVDLVRESLVQIVVAPAPDSFECGKECRSSMRIDQCDSNPCLKRTGDCQSIPGYVKDVLLQDRRKPSMTVLRKGEFTLTITLNPINPINPISPGEELLKSVFSSLRAWLLFGGIGARTRRGAGCLSIVQSNLKGIEPNQLNLDSKQPFCEPAQVPTLYHATIFKGAACDDAPAAWRKAINLWRAFRKGIDVRNGLEDGLTDDETKGASGWPDWETSLDASTNSNVVSISKASLGLPYTLYCPITRKEIKYTLGDISTRMGSCVITKPVFVSGHWHPAWICLNAPKFEDERVTSSTALNGARISTQYCDMPYSPIDEPEDETWSDLFDLVRYFAVESGWSEQKL